jgi:hypothetical protein
VTIRDYIQRRFGKLVLIFLLPYGLLQCLRVALNYWPNAFALKPRLLVLLLTEPRFAVIFVAWFGVRLLTIPCPRCARPLGAAVAVVWGSTKINRCPNCRVNLDEPTEISADQKEDAV